jgi:hypothetical protein
MNALVMGIRVGRVVGAVVVVGGDDEAAAFLDPDGLAETVDELPLLGGPGER